MNQLRCCVTCAMFPAEICTSGNVGVDGVGGGLTLLLGKDGLLFKERGKELVGVLNRAKRQDTGCVDLVEYRHFGVQIRIGRERILFEVCNLGLDVLSIPTDCADCRPLRSCLRRPRVLRRRIETALATSSSAFMPES